MAIYRIPEEPEGPLWDSKGTNWKKVSCEEYCWKREYEGGISCDWNNK